MVTYTWIVLQVFCLTCNKEKLSVGCETTVPFSSAYLYRRFPLQRLIQTPSQLPLRYLCYMTVQITDKQQSAVLESPCNKNH